MMLHNSVKAPGNSRQASPAMQETLESTVGFCGLNSLSRYGDYIRIPGNPNEH
jgi:hypothetical protein